MSARGRKPAPAPEAPTDALDSHALARASEAADTLGAVNLAIAQSAELHKMVGRIETAHFMETVSAKLIAETYLKAKALLGEVGSVTVIGPTGKTETVSGMEQFCELAMPVSARRCQQIVSSIELLGPALFEQAERIGFRARDYQALKALPSDEQALVTRAMESGSKDDVLDLLTELAGRNEALRKQAELDKKSLAAKDKVIQAKSAKLDKIEEDAAARRNATMEEAEAFQMDDLRNDTLGAETSLLRMLATVDEVLAQPATGAAEQAARHSLDYLVQRIVDACNSRGITVDLAERVTPIWAQPIEAAAAAASGRKGKK